MSIYRTTTSSLFITFIAILFSPILLAAEYPPDSGGDSSSDVVDSPLAHYAELALMLIPQRKSNIKQRLRRACRFLPMPLSIGWSTDSEEEMVSDKLIPGLRIIDVKSGATRKVRSAWMHALY